MTPVARQIAALTARIGTWRGDTTPTDEPDEPHTSPRDGDWAADVEERRTDRQWP